MTSNLVSMDISSEEVNNNNQEKAGCSGAIEPALVFNRKEATTGGDTSASTVPAAAIVSLSSSSPTASVYSLNDTFRIKVTSAEEWLCVARMPRDFTQTELESLLDEFGPIQQCFLIHSELSGTSKGYGLVKYASKASSIQARHVLEGYQVRDGHTLDCDWLQHNRPVDTVTSLHSKCLYVDQLPADYRDMAQFRRLFSKVVNPPYCQIAIKNGVIHNWGLVEYQTSQDAEATMQALEGETIDGLHPIRVQYCIPGVHAINIYMAFVNNPMDAISEKKALMEEAPSSKVYDQLNSLAKHNPWFVANLQNIMASSGGGGGANGGQQQGHAPLPPLKLAALPPSSSSSQADPAQAALILLLAGKVAQGPPDQTASLLQGIVKQMSNGVNATEILRGIIKPQHNEDIIQTAIKMASLPGSSALSGGAGGGVAEAAKTASTNSGGSSDKCPLLMELLYKSFQARLAKEHRLKALKQIEHQEKSQSSLKPNHSSAISALLASAQAASTASVPTSVQHTAGPPLQPVNANHQTFATSAPHTTNPMGNPMEATMNQFTMNSPELMAAAAAAFNQQQAAAHIAAPPPPPPPAQPPLASYPLFSYYMNPMHQWASAAQYFQQPGLQQPQSLMIPNLMQGFGSLTSQVHTAGVKRAAAPFMYPNSGTIEKRMKLA